MRNIEHDTRNTIGEMRNIERDTRNAIREILKAIREILKAIREILKAIRETRYAKCEILNAICEMRWAKCDTRMSPRGLHSFLSYFSCVERFIVAGKGFFKLSQLACLRWPNVGIGWQRRRRNSNVGPTLGQRKLNCWITIDIQGYQFILKFSFLRVL